jgi:fructose-1,6-bisphosphatase II / sedoheptulose-1,7-bisphosphatase
MCCRLLFNDDLQVERAVSMGIKDINKKYRIDDMVSDEVIFSATGVTSGDLLDGVSLMHGVFTTHSIILRSSVTDILKVINHHT